MRNDIFLALSFIFFFLSLFLPPSPHPLLLHLSAMYLTQGVSALLFTIIRTALQMSIIFLISHLASRTRNLTYQERINGGSLNSINYLLFTKFSPRRQHLLGRFYVALALVITFALNLLPTLLSDIYPVLPTFLPSNLKELDIFTAFVKTTSLEPNKTSVENILFNMGVPLNGSVFDSYVASPAERLPCRNFQSTVYCANETFTFGGIYYDEYSLALGLRGVDGLSRMRNWTTPTGESFDYFNTTDSMGSYGLAEMFVNAGEAETDNFYDMSYSSPRSLETCLIRNSKDHRCVRHSLGYLLSKTSRIFLITRRVYTLTIARELNITFNTTIPTFIDPSVNTTLDCSRLPTSTLETMCRQINSLGAPPLYRLYTIQQQSIDQNGRLHWDVINTRLNIQLSSNAISNNTFLLVLEAFHLDVGVEYYNSTMEQKKGYLAVKGDNIAYLRVRGRETFETTYIVPKRTVGFYNHSWVDWGFSKEDIHNLTDFLQGGTMLNSGTLMMRTPELLANISDLAVGLMLGASVIMVGLGFFLSRAVDSVVRDPFTEVLPKVLDSMRPGGSKINTTTSLRYRRVANITLVPSQASPSSEQTSDPASASAAALIPRLSPLQDVDVDNDGKRSATACKTKTLLLRMDIDSDDEEMSVIELFEPTTKDHSPA